MELAPNPWIRTKSGRVGFLDLGTQQCIMVPSLRSVKVDRSPRLLKVDLRHRFLAAVKLKHLGITEKCKLQILFLCVFFFTEFEKKIRGLWGIVMKKMESG